MQLEQMREIAESVMFQLMPACLRCTIAGSIRRGKAQPKDIEIVYVPRMIDQMVDLLTVEQVPATNERIVELVRNGFWRFDDELPRNGPKYKRLIYNRSGVVIELFRAELETWGYILALRTGPGDFNRLWASHPWHGGFLPIDIKLLGGQVWKRGQFVHTPTEREFFALIGIPWLAPEERTVSRLVLEMAERRRGV